MTLQPIATPSAPAAVGPYSQAIRAGNVVYCSGQLGLHPATGQLAEGFAAQAQQVLDNLEAVAQGAGASLAQVVKLTLYLTDLNNFALINELMQQRFAQPFPARSTVAVAALPRGAQLEIDAVLVLD